MSDKSEPGKKLWKPGKAGTAMQRAGYKYCAIRPSAGQRETVFDGGAISALPVGGALFLFKFLIWEVTILKSLEKFETCDLVKELKGREGIETKIAEPYQDIDIKINGPAIVLIVTD